MKTSIADTDLVALQDLPRVRGVALDADGVVTVLLEADDDHTRGEVFAWGQRRTRLVDIKVIGPLVL